jgi:uncharacterized protein YutE (UPF0331/DUF86 family)
MSSIDVIENKISAVKKYLEILVRYKKYSVEEISKDIDIRGAVERYLYLAVQAAIDLAEDVIAYKDLRKPSSLAESFDILFEYKVVEDRYLIERLVKMTGFRNVMAHDYGKIDYNIVYDILHNRLVDIKNFAKIIESAI